jgi:ElaB/YqjD/DUF883 family membrane-anchored ribosome-binding protein
VNGQPATPTAAELMERIRRGRERLDATFDHIEQRIAVVVETKDRVVRLGRLTAVVVGVVTVTLAAGLLLRALVRPRGRSRR